MSDPAPDPNTPTTGEIMGQDFPDGTLRVLQITDTHLYDDPEGDLLGVKTLHSLRDVISHFLGQGWRPDLVVATGDLAHDASPLGYQRLIEEFSRLKAPVYCLAGNHDEAAALADTLRGDNISAPGLVDRGNWRFILLNTSVPGSEGGRLSETELQRLEQQLAETDKHTLVCLHHQPIPVGCTWLDTMAVENGDALFEIIDRHANVSGLLWGHVHQIYDQVRHQAHNRVRLMASPSTCIQFAPRLVDFKLDAEPPGYRLLALQPDGQIFSEVMRIEGLPEGLDLASGGY